MHIANGWPIKCVQNSVCHYPLHQLLTGFTNSVHRVATHVPDSIQSPKDRLM